MPNPYGSIDTTSIERSQRRVGIPRLVKQYPTLLTYCLFAASVAILALEIGQHAILSVGGRNEYAFGGSVAVVVSAIAVCSAACCNILGIFFAIAGLSGAKGSASPIAKTIWNLVAVSLHLMCLVLLVWSWVNSGAPNP